MAHEHQTDVKPNLEAIVELLSHSSASKYPPNLVPLCAQIPADLLTPTLAYLRISEGFANPDLHLKHLSPVDQEEVVVLV